MLIKTLLLSIAWSIGGCQGASSPSSQDMPTTQETVPPTGAPATQPAPVPDEPRRGEPIAPVPPRADDLLDRLEKSAADLTAFTADITYEKVDSILGRREIRTGELIYRLDPSTKEKSFAILFDTLVIPPRRENQLKHFVFNGRWLAEIDHKNKQFIKREIVPPGKVLDPLKLGEGPFPLPIGQPKREVLARFDVTAAEIPDQGLLKELKDEEVEGLLLVPKPEVKEAKEFAKIELFYDHATLLPVGIHTVEVNGDEKTVRLTNVKRNPALDDQAIQKLSVAEPDPRQWKIDVRPWSEPD